GEIRSQGKAQLAESLAQRQRRPPGGRPGERPDDIRPRGVRRQRRDRPRLVTRLRLGRDAHGPDGGAPPQADTMDRGGRFSPALPERSSTPAGGLPPLNAVRVFEAVGRTGSVTAAAGELCVTPSAVSHQLRTLEHQLDVKLFLRRGRAMELTDPGRAFFGAISPALADIVRGTAAVFGRDARRCITIAAMPVFAVRWLIPRLGAFRRRHPEVEARVSTSYRYVDLH